MAHAALSAPEITPVKQSGQAASSAVSKRIPLSVPHMGSTEIHFVQEAFATNWISPAGPNLEAFERRMTALTGLPAVALTSGTASIHLGLKLLGVSPGDEVVVPTLTFVAAANPVLYLNAVPVLIDSARESWNLDPELLAEFFKKRAKVNRLPRAVIVVHLYGQCADMEPILALCRQYGVGVLEDAADALGAYYKGQIAGSLGDVGIYSLNGNKIITCSGGGILVSSNREWVEKARSWATQAREPDPLNHYVHSEVGYNYRLSNVLAGIARGQLDLLEERVQQRRAVFKRYVDGFAALEGIEGQPESAFGSETARSKFSHTRWLSCFLIDEARFGMSRDALIRYLDAANIESRPVWKPMHTQKLYAGYECIGGGVAEDLNRRGICLPSSSCLSEEEQRYVIEKVREASSQGRRG